MNEEGKSESREEKLKELFLNQKHTLDLFLERGRRTDDRQWRKFRRV